MKSITVKPQTNAIASADNAPMAMDPIRVGQIFAQSGLFPDTKSEAQCATKLIVGQGMGLTPYDAMSGLHIIQGKVVLAANLMSAAIKRNPKYDYRADTTKDSCTITFFDTSSGAPEKIGETTFSMEDARLAGLNGANWKKYPKAMLFARCISAGYREHCPDALGHAPVYVEAHGEMEIEDPRPAAARPSVFQQSIEEDQTDTLKDLVAQYLDAGGGQERIDGMCDHYNVENIDEMSPQQVADAVGKLQTIIVKLQEEPASA